MGVCVCVFFNAFVITKKKHKINNNDTMVCRRPVVRNIIIFSYWRVAQETRASLAPCCSSRTFARMERIADESGRARAPETPFAVVAHRVFTARRPAALVHVVTSRGPVSVARVSFGTLAVVTAREVRAQGPGTAGVRHVALVHVRALSANEMTISDWTVLALQKNAINIRNKT